MTNEQTKLLRDIKDEVLNMMEDFSDLETQVLGELNKAEDYEEITKWTELLDHLCKIMIEGHALFEEASIL